MWPTLAADCGLELVLVPDAGALDRRTDAVGVVSAGGAEERLEETLRTVTAGRVEIVAVGTLPDHRLAAAVVRAGAADYFALPSDLEVLRSWLTERAERLTTGARRRAFADGESGKYRFDGILGESAALRQALDLAARVIPHGGVTVLITGETGTGKELLARAIHYNGPRREAPFVDVNCAAIPEQLLESELFGHEKGAFTDASSAKPGLFEVANGGTLFLDEIGQLALPLQGKLLRALEERSVRRLGGTKSTPFDVRLLAATHVDLSSAVRRGAFREDLYYRLNVVPIELPPLRARRGDVVPLARHFLARFASEYAMSVPTITVSGERALAARSWAGNVRELRNLMERTLLLGDGTALDAGDFSAPAGPVVRESGALPFPATLGAITRAAARDTLELCGGNKSAAARQLGITRPRLQRLLNARNDNEANTTTDMEGDDD